MCVLVHQFSFETFLLAFTSHIFVVWAQLYPFARTLHIHVRAIIAHIDIGLSVIDKALKDFAI